MSEMRARLLIVITTCAAALVLSGCSDDDSDAVTATTTTTATVVHSVSDAPPSSSTPSATSDSGVWTGTWESLGESRAAVLTVSSTDPLTARIDITPGRCGATWTEESRRTGADGVVVEVAARVTYGECSDNRWTVRLTPDRISGIDTTDPSTTVNFTRD